MTTKRLPGQNCMNRARPVQTIRNGPADHLFRGLVWGPICRKKANTPTCRRKDPQKSLAAFRIAEKDLEDPVLQVITEADS